MQYYISTSVLTAILYLQSVPLFAMCHCFDELDELSESEQAELLEEHSTNELRAELSTGDFETLGITS